MVLHKRSSPSGLSDEDAIRLLQELVSIASPSGHESEAVDYFVHWMSDHGFKAEADASGSAVGIRGSGDHDLVLLGHIDTFPGEPPIRREDGKLYGRGSVDAKGALAAFAMAAASVEPVPGVRLVVIGATEEESLTSRGAHHALKEYKPFACLIGEPSGWDRITLGYRGQMTLRWSWRGPLAHSAAPVSSPAEVAFGVWRAIVKETEDINTGDHPEFQRFSAALKQINSGVDGCHGWAEMEVSLRLPRRMRTQGVRRRIASLDLPGRYRFIGSAEPFLAEKNTPLVAALLGAIRSSGGDPRFVLKTGTSDMNVVGPVWNCPIVAYGPGDSRLDHTPDEYLDLEEYLRSVKILRNAIPMLANGAVADHR